MPPLRGFEAGKLPPFGAVDDEREDPGAAGEGHGDGFRRMGGGGVTAVGQRQAERLPRPAVEPDQRLPPVRQLG